MNWKLDRIAVDAEIIFDPFAVDAVEVIQSDME